VVPAFTAAKDFAITKPAGRPCPNLRHDFRCGIHADLRERGFPGCTVYDCFGAGQQVSQVTFGGTDWRTDAGTRTRMFAVFPIMRQLHELLWYLTEARDLPEAAPIHDDLARAYADTDRMTAHSPAELAELAELDLSAHRERVNELLRQASELARAAISHRRTHRGADLVGARLAGADLRGACLRGACLIGADLRTADLRRTDVTGADFRDADLRGADLTGALFLIQSQLAAATGDATTKIPAHAERPAHWSG